jgi:hypothetical protein
MPTSLTVNVNPRSLAAGTYFAEINIIAATPASR